MISNQSTGVLYNQYKEIMQKIADVKTAAAVLQWDEETYLPPNGAAGRARQLATLSEVAHQMGTTADLGDLLTELNSRDDLASSHKKNISLSLEDYNKIRKFSPAFVRLMSETVSKSFHAWIEARGKNDFNHFEPLLQKLVELKKQEAQILGFEHHPYNALLNEYEKGATVQMLDQLFADLKLPLQQLFAEVQSLPQPDASFLHQFFPKDQQWKWGQEIARILGFDFSCGRQDIAGHPFSTSFNTSDVRITTRIDEHDFANMTWSTIHEVGHALYEQGLPPEEYGLPIGEYASLSVHESQSRLWENCVCRGLPFWQYYLPHLKTYFPDQFKNVGVKQFVQAINKVQPSLIRTEADELTYHFHVMIRYELEKKLIGDELMVKDIPAYWNHQYNSLLGVTVPDDNSGCLQDVHWSHGSFGYFATYSLGSFYAAQFWKQAQHEMPHMISQIENEGDTGIVLAWLRKQVHPHGKFYTSEELCKHITGKGLDSRIFIEYLRQKLLGLMNG